MSNGEGVLNHLLHVLGSNCVQDVEGVLPVGYPALGIVIREEDKDLGVLLDQRPDRLDGDLVELGNVYRAQGGHLDELLVIREHLLEEVFVNHGGWWNVELDYQGKVTGWHVLTAFSEVVNEVGFGFELREYLLRLHIVIEGALLATRRWHRLGLLHVDVDHATSKVEFKINFDYQGEAIFLC